MSERWLWTQKEDIGPSPRYDYAMAYEAARQRVVLCGGSGSTGALFNDTWGWDGAAWTQVEDMGPPARRNHAMAYDDSRQRLVLFGGYNNSISPAIYFGDTWEWDGTEWTQVADIGPAARVNHALAYDTVRQQVVLFGGENPRIAPPLRTSTTRGSGTAQNGPRLPTRVRLLARDIRWSSIVHASALCFSVDGFEQAR
jgi:hypothetical protein